MRDFVITRLLCRPARLRDLARQSVASSLLALAALSSTACGADPEPAGPEAIALRAVAEALGIAPAGSRVISSEARDFPDASLGCPQPGMAYAQVITPGHRVLVEANGRRFDVRVAGNLGRICHLRKPTRDSGSSVPVLPRESGEAARQDLALRLGLPPEAVAVTGLRRLKPGESLAGCGEVCAPDAGDGACGVGIRLHSGERDYDYIALPAGVRPCPDIAPR
ncbi:MAG: hypothetical protein JNK40_04405 [Chromatiales bacterium]|nr:hypothetical protein [Chromatiales bacterium]